MRVQTCLFTVSFAVAVVAVACGSNPPPQPSTGTTTTSAALPESVSQIASARCKHAAACNEVGGDRTYANMDACMSKMRGDAENDLRASNCPKGVNDARLRSCVAEINAEACSGIGSGLSRGVACKTSALCP
jgi:hypothetical protein